MQQVAEARCLENPVAAIRGSKHNEVAILANGLGMRNHDPVAAVQFD